MAIIGKIREKSTLVLIIIGGAIVAFVLSDLFSSSAGGRPQGPMFLAQVKEHSISPDEYEQQLQTAYENFEARSETPMDARTKGQIKENVWNQILSSYIIGDEREALGVKVTSKELFDMVQGDNPHPQVRQIFTNPETGEFNSSAVVQFLQNLDQGDPKTKEQWISFEKALKSNQEMDKYNNLIKKGMYMPSELAKQQYADNRTSLSFKFVSQLYMNLPDSVVEVSDAELKEYYEEHKDEYEQPYGRRMFYAFFPVRPSDADVEATYAEANRVYEKFKTASNDSIFVNANSDTRFDPMFYTIENIPLGIDTMFWKQDSGSTKAPFKLENVYYIHKIRDVKMAPDSVQASHILIGGQTRSPEAAEALADSLLEVLKNGQGVMSELASEYSDDATSAVEGGDLGWFAEGTMVKPFSDAAFSMEVGEYRKVLSQFGYHIIQVNGKTEDKRKVQFATVRIDINPSKETYANIFNEANSFSIDATDGESFNTLVNDKRLQRRSVVLSEQMTTLNENEATRELVRWAKEAKEGDISEAYDIGDAFAVGHLEKINEEGPAPFEDVRNRVEYAVRVEKKAEKFINEMSGFSNLTELAAKLNLTVESAENVTFSDPSIPNKGVEPKVIGKAMSLEAGQMSVPLKGGSGVYVLAIESKSDAGEPNIAMTRGSWQRGFNSQIDNGSVFNALKEEVEIEDNRTKFF